MRRYGSIQGQTNGREDIPGYRQRPRDTWNSTFRGLLPDDFLDGMSLCRARSSGIAGPSRLPRRPITSPLTRRAGTHIIGFASGGPIRYPLSAYQNELYAIYVLERLAGPADRHAFAAGCRSARLLVDPAGKGCRCWVLAGNSNRAFYARHGGRVVATKPMTLGSATVDQVAYAWDDLQDAGLDAHRATKRLR